MVGDGCNSGVECLASTDEILGSIFTTLEGKQEFSCRDHTISENVVVNRYSFWKYKSKT